MMTPHRPCEQSPRTPSPRAAGQAGPQQRFLYTLSQIGSGSFGDVFLCAQVRERQPAFAGPEAAAAAVKAAAAAATAAAQAQAPAPNSAAKAGPELVAVKRVLKSQTQSKELLDQLAMELAVLKIASKGRFLLGFEWAHETEQCVLMCTEYCPGGDLFTLSGRTDLSDDSCALIVAQVAIALNYLHRNNIVYRDLKPENVALSRTGHVRLLDFGLATILTEEHRNPENGRLEVLSTSGTLAYTAPEVLRRVPHSIEADFWGLGMLAHELFTGGLPFCADDPKQHCARICTEPLDLSVSFTPGTAAGDLIAGLLQRDRPQRLGYHLERFEDDILKHTLFQGVVWALLEDETQRLPYAPRLTGPLDLSNFLQLAAPAGGSVAGGNHNDHTTTTSATSS